LRASARLEPAAGGFERQSRVPVRGATKFCEITEQNDLRRGRRSAASGPGKRSRPFCRAANRWQSQVPTQVKPTCLAERAGFEPAVGLLALRRFSKPLV